jgi:hypothetical protein
MQTMKYTHVASHHCTQAISLTGVPFAAVLPERVGAPARPGVLLQHQHALTGLRQQIRTSAPPTATPDDNRVNAATFVAAAAATTADAVEHILCCICRRRSFRCRVGHSCRLLAGWRWRLKGTGPHGVERCSTGGPVEEPRRHGGHHGHCQHQCWSEGGDGRQGVGIRRQPQGRQVRDQCHRS